MSSELEVAVLGTGIMGTGMARSLRRAGITVRVWNRSPDKAQPLADSAVIATTPAEAVAGADAVLTMLFDADVVLAVAREFVDAQAPGAIWIQSATIGPDGMNRVADFAAEHNVTVIDAPVLGTKGPAEQGTLVVLASGPNSAITAVQPVFDAIGSRTVRAGDQLGRASALKLACNAWVASINAATAQSIALTRGLDLDPQLFLEAIRGTATDSPYAQLKGKQMIAEDYSPAFAIDGVVKDVELILAAAHAGGVDRTLLQALRELYRRASESGYAAADMAAVASEFQSRQ
jgi:3-hydroxyisobutyrate dehydrogenase